MLIPNNTARSQNIVNKIIAAGIAAITHLTIKNTIEENDILISLTTTSLELWDLFSVSFIILIFLQTY